MIYPLFRRR
jgi:hypothetical protein